MRNVSDILYEKYYIARPLKIIYEKNNKIRLNLVTDDISKKSLFGGVATSLILATLLCKRNEWTLRLITRWTPCNLNDYYEFANLLGLEVPREVESYSDENTNDDRINFRLTLSENDIFLATSWWSAKSILDSNIRDRIMYIIQEEETFFYPYGDERFTCEQIMNSPQIDYIINSKLLFDYLNMVGYRTLIDNGLWFEPAFSEKLYYADENTFQKPAGQKKKLFFYGRPMNPRNLYYFGLECMDDALTQGIIDTDLWDIYLAGYDIDGIKFSNGYEPKMNGTMSWEAYAEFARTVDVSFSLMYTPHPSYPPLDMLCSGAVVLTNEFKNKRDLSYSDNMILAKLEKEDILKKLEIAISLSNNKEKRKENYLNNHINRDWAISFEKILPVLEERIKTGDYV